MVIFLLTSFALAYFLFPAFIKLLKSSQILDSPDDRKIHNVHTPSLGGVPIFLSVAFSIMLWIPEFSDQYKYLFAAATLMFVVGLRDDVIPLHAGVKLGSQLIPIFLLISWGGFEITSFYNLLPGTSFPPILVFLVSLFVFVVITNAFNLIDGIDGLAGSVGLIGCVFYGIWFYLSEVYVASFFACAIAGGLISFLIFNWQPSRVFMGDTGALTLGLILASFTILFLNKNFYLPEQHPARFISGIGTALSVIILPLTDTLRVFVIRISQGRSPFSADNNHIHHLLLRLGFSHAKATSVLVGISLFFVLIACIGNTWPSYFVVLLIIGLDLISVGTLLLVVKSRLKAQPQKASI